MTKKTRRRRAKVPYLRSNRFGIYIIHYYTDAGKKRQFSTETTDFALADQALTEFKGKGGVATYDKGRELLWETACRQWYEEVAAPDNVERSLKKTVGMLWRLGMMDLEAKLPPGSIGLRKIVDTPLKWMEKWWERLQQEPRSIQRYKPRGRLHARDELSDDMIGQAQDFIKAILRHAIHKQRIDAAWCPIVERVPYGDRRVTFWNFDEKDMIDSAIEAASPTEDGPGQGPPSRLLIYWTIALGCGVRKHRLLHAKWDLVDFEQRTIDLTRVYSPPESRDQEDMEHKTNKPGTIYHFGDDPEAERVLAWAYRTKKNDYLFYHPGDIYNEFKAMLRAKSLKGSPHIIKHTMATLLIQRGIPVEKVSEITGTSVRILLKYYKHLMPKDHGAIVADALRRKRPAPGVIVLPRRNKRGT